MAFSHTISKDSLGVSNAWIVIRHRACRQKPLLSIVSFGFSPAASNKRWRSNPSNRESLIFASGSELEGRPLQVTSEPFERPVFAVVIVGFSNMGVS